MEAVLTADIPLPKVRNGSDPTVGRGGIHAPTCNTANLSLKHIHHILKYMHYLPVSMPLVDVGIL